MSWSPLPSLRSAQVHRSRPPITAATTSGGGRMSPAMTLMIRPAQIEGCTWLTPGARVEVLVGHADHAGMLRIEPGSSHKVGAVALAKPAGSLVQLRLPLLPGLAAAARPALVAQFTHGGQSIEVTLPRSWGLGRDAKPAPAATSMDRGKELAAQAAAEARRRAGL